MAAAPELSTLRRSGTCGYGVPRYRHEGPRTQLVEWAEHKGDEGLEVYRRERNARSIDGLKGID
jgi:hypothetical protein